MTLTTCSKHDPPNTWIFSVEAEHTTARYFEACVKADHQSNVVYTSDIHDLNGLNENDLFFFIDPAPNHWPKGFERLRGSSAAYLIDVHQGLDLRLAYAPFFDVLFVAQKDYVRTFKELGFANVFWLPLAMDPGVHLSSHTQRDIDLGFVGQLGPAGTFRNDVLSFVLTKFETNNYRQFYSPREMAEIYGRSKIVINASMNGDLNMRVFEALASGALLISDRIRNGMLDILNENEHFVGYSTPAEAVDKINYYLSHPTEMEAIASRGQKLVMANHTYAHRWHNALSVIKSGCREAASIRHYKQAQQTHAYATVFERLRLPSRVLGLLFDYPANGFSLSPLMLRALARKVNARMRISPGAVRMRLGK